MEKLEEAVAYLTSKGLFAKVSGDDFPFIEGHLPANPDRAFKIVSQVSDEMAEPSFLVEAEWDENQICWLIETAAEVVVSKYLAYGWLQRTPISGSWFEDAKALDFMGASSIDVTTVRGLVKEMAGLRGTIEAVVTRLEGRRDAAGRTAMLHPDAASREVSKVRHDTYVQALNDIRILAGLVS